jgi:hypothetical protein
LTNSITFENPGPPTCMIQDIYCMKKAMFFLIRQIEYEFSFSYFI